MFLCFFSAQGQTLSIPGQSRLDSLKITGRLEEYFKAIDVPGDPITFSQAQLRSGVQSVNRPASTSCNCWIPRDATWNIVPFTIGSPPDYRNDDGSTSLITIPFNLCFYGQPVNQIYINNNGNISIGSSYSTFSASSFPTSSFSMIAPFWADVDTRGTGSGLVYYKVTPTYMIIQWDNVGYFSSMFDKLNTFQLIITDGNDPIINPGNNVQFCYKDMQWTTGAASQGVNGFGGVPATVGVNRGNGTDYIQIGRYDQAGIAYDGPYGNNDGVSMLDFQTYLFNVCVSSSNIPPIIQSDQVCDTLTLCENDTLLIDANFLSPEAGQTTVPNVNPNGMPGVSVVTSTSGNIAAEQVQIIGQPGNLGFHTIFLTATDNGTPAQTSQAPIVISVQSAPNITSCSFTPSTPQQVGTSITFNSTAIGGFQYLWNFGDGGPTSSLPNTFHVFTAAGTYQVVLTVTGISGCVSRDTLTVTVTACATAGLTVTDVCEGLSSTVTFTGNAVPGAQFTWNFSGGTVVSGSGQGPYEILWSTDGSFPVQVNVDVPNCTTATAVATVNILNAPEAEILYPDSLCSNLIGSLIFSGNAGPSATYQWDFGSGNVLNGSGPGPYLVQWNTPGPELLSVIVEENGCSDTSVVPLYVKVVPTAIFAATPDVCIGSDAEITYAGTGGASAVLNWDVDSGSVTGSGDTLLVRWDSPGQHPVTLTVVENGCVSNPEVVPVNVVAPPTADAGSDVSGCSGQDVFVGNSASSGDTYSWHPGGLVGDSASAFTAVTLNNTANADITNTLTLITVNWLGCSDTDQVTVTTYRVAVIPFQAPPPQCISGNSFLFAASGTYGNGYSYEWYFGMSTDTGFSPSPVSYTSTGYHTVTLQPYYLGCPGELHTDSILVTAMPVADFEALQLEGCEPLTVPFNDLSSGNGLSYSWSFSDNSTASGDAPVHVFQSDGTYDVLLTVQSSEGCSDDTLYPGLITVFPNPVADFVPTTMSTDILNPSFGFDNTSLDGITYSWDFGDGTTTDLFEPGHEYSDTGNYRVTLFVTSEHGCVDSVYMILRVDPWFSFYVPNAFSPNGDERNETFGGYGTWVKACVMDIYDRWGRVIFHSDNIEQRWDGRVDSAVQNEAYTYRIVVTDFFDEEHVYVGRLSIIH
ncbi:MAG: hypothetical protein RL213_1130 [Bacteroidota bacterium]